MNNVIMNYIKRNVITTVPCSDLFTIFSYKPAQCDGIYWVVLQRRTAMRAPPCSTRSRKIC